MTRIRCLLGIHAAILDYSQCLRPERKVIVGQVIRRCRHCAVVLDGDVPFLGDRLREEDLPPVMTYEEAGWWDMTGVAPERLYGKRP